MAQQQTGDIDESRFIHYNGPQCQDTNVSPIWGYQHMPVMKLEEAMREIIFTNHDIKKDIDQATIDCKKVNTKLTLDESAAIRLYTMTPSVYKQLNAALRTENRNELEKWFPYLRLLITALNKLPSLPTTTVYRGVADDISFNFDEDKSVQRWWSINSCSTDLKVIEHFLGGSGTFFIIETSYGKNISEYSAKRDEKEIILMPGTRVRLQCAPLEIQNRPYTFSLREW